MKLIIMLAIIFLLLASLDGYAEDIAIEYEPLTLDYEAVELGEVVVTEKTISSSEITWTLNEIDTYIKLNEAEIKKFQDNIDYFKKIRLKVEAEAKKVKLSVGPKVES